MTAGAWDGCPVALGLGLAVEPSADRLHLIKPSHEREATVAGARPLQASSFKVTHTSFVGSLQVESPILCWLRKLKDLPKLQRVSLTWYVDPYNLPLRLPFMCKPWLLSRLPMAHNALVAQSKPCHYFHCSHLLGVL